MTGGGGHTRKYVLVFAGLAVLTLLELAAAEIETSYLLKASSLTALAVAKAFAVAYWFMHLDEETPWLRVLSAVPISAAVFAVVVMLESLNR